MLNEPKNSDSSESLEETSSVSTSEYPNDDTVSSCDEGDTDTTESVYDDSAASGNMYDDEIIETDLGVDDSLTEETQEKHKKSVFVRIFYGAIFVICLAVLVYLAIQIGTYLYNNLHTSEQQEQYLEEETNEDGDEAADNHGIDWEKLTKNNDDVYAWIYIPDTEVDYAVVQSSEDEDDDFYLSHNLDKEYEFAGSIYSEKQNAKDFSDPVTVLYGHNMLNGTMFATLHYFEDEDFFDSHKYMYVYQEGLKLTYKIYAAYVYDDRHILNSFDFSKPKILKKYQKYTLDPDSTTKNTRKATLDEDSKILTLSTCTNTSDTTRYLVQGVLIKTEETASYVPDESKDSESTTGSLED